MTSDHQRNKSSLKNQVYMLFIAVAFSPCLRLSAEPVSFANDIVPMLTRAGCNSGGCHGKQAGRNGFKLSLFGFDPAFDFQALTGEARGRRVSPAAPHQSLVLLKAINKVPHGGGMRFDHDSKEYRMFHSWIASGMQFGLENEPQLTGIKARTERKVARKGPYEGWSFLRKRKESVQGLIFLVRT